MAIRIKDIAKMVGCSEATVSLALNNSNLVKRETKELILKTAEEVGYVPNVSPEHWSKRRVAGLAW